MRGLNDSKLLTFEKRSHLFGRIQKIALAIGIGIVEADEIDTLNIFHANILAMRKALEALSIKPTFTLIDGPSLRWLEYPHEGIIGGDGKSALIAAASIIAKVTRDQIMIALHEKYPGYEFHRHKGYSTELHLERLRALGPCPVHRRSFAPVANWVNVTTAS